MNYTALEIAEILNGRIQGDPNTLVNAPAGIENAMKENISFLANMKYEDLIYSTSAGIVLVAEEFEPREKLQSTLIHVPNVYAAVGTLLKRLAGEGSLPQGISEKASVSADAGLAENVVIGDYSVVSEEVAIGKNTVIHPQVFIDKGVKIGENCKIYPGVRIMHQCKLGDNCIIHPNTVIGSDGFGYSKNEDKSYEKIPQIGIVVIGNDVEIGANVCIDRATMGVTRIEDGVKLDNLIQIAHNVKVGEHTAIAAQSGIAGSTSIGKHSIMGGQSGVAGHLNLADKLKIQAQAGVNSDKHKEGSSLSGTPSIAYRGYLRSYAIFRELPDLKEQIETLSKTIRELKDSES